MILFLPIISGPNVTLIPAHGMDKLSHLVQGKPEEDRYMARNRVDIIYDRHLSDRLQSELYQRMVVFYNKAAVIFYDVTK